MIETVRIDTMSPDDWPAVRAIYEAGIATGVATFETQAPTWDAWDAAHRPDCRLVARDGEGRVVGWIAISPVSPRRVYAGVVEESVYIAPDARGHGIGTRLFEALFEAAEAAGVWTIQAGIQLENEASMRLHERVGFRRIGVRERIGRDAGGTWRDVVILERRSERVGV